MHQTSYAELLLGIELESVSDNYGEQLADKQYQQWVVAQARDQANQSADLVEWLALVETRCDDSLQESMAAGLDAESKGMDAPSVWMGRLLAVQAYIEAVGGPKPSHTAEAETQIHVLHRGEFQWPNSAPFFTPAGWLADESGLHREKSGGKGEVWFEKVVERPVCVVNRQIDVDDHSESWTLAWLERGQWRQMECSRVEAQTARNIVALSGRGLPVSSSSASDLVTYLEKFVALNVSQIPTRYEAGHCGWIGYHPKKDGSAPDRWAFLHGGLVVGQRLVTLADQDPEGTGKLAKACRTVGSRETWRELLPIAEKYPSLLVALGAGLASVALTPLGLDGFVVSLDGRTSAGKTTALRIPASLWGNPEERGEGAYLMTWATTRFAIEHYSAALNSLPLCIDDTARWEDRRHKPGDVVYQLTQGVGKSRGASSDRMRATRRWAFTTISTGEDPLCSSTQRGGLRARVLQLWGSPFGGSAREDVAAVNRICRSNYGHEGQAWLWAMMKRDNASGFDALQTLSERRHELLAVWDVPGDVASRLVAHAALVGACLWCASEWLQWPTDLNGRELAEAAWSAMRSGIVEANVDADPADRGWEELQTWIAANLSRFDGEGVNAEREPHGGWLGVRKGSEVRVVPEAFRRWADGNNYHGGDALLRQWAEDGRLIRYEGRRLASQKKLRNRRVRLYCFHMPQEEL